MCGGVMVCTPVLSVALDAKGGIALVGMGVGCGLFFWGDTGGNVKKTGGDPALRRGLLRTGVLGNGWELQWDWGFSTLRGYEKISGNTP